jgi:hypothetical protein
VVKDALEDLRIGDVKLELDNKQESNNIQSVLLREIKEKLYGKEVKARGSIMFVHDELWFFPSQLQFSYILHSKEYGF